MKTSLSIGLTGGIGSGKSLVCDLFSILNISIFNSDLAAKALMVKSPLKNKIIDLLGSEAFDGPHLNRPWIAKQIFQHKHLLESLNTIVHPAVGTYFKEWQVRQESPYTIQETAILFESGLESRYDHIITVVAPVDIRINRVTNRDNTKVEEVQKRINNQWTDEQRIAKSDFVIQNHSNIPLIPQVLAIHSSLITK